MQAMDRIRACGSPCLVARSQRTYETNPAARGSAITIYGTGEGRTGFSATSTVDGQPMDIASFGPSLEKLGMFELVAYVPAGYFPAGAKTLRVSVGGSMSQSGVIVFVR